MSDPQKYTVGWICAITTEFVAAQAFLDEKHDNLKVAADNDNNNYAMGRIGEHNVVMAVLPKSEYGTTSAATVARDMVRSFPNIRFGLMVGIGGGAPSAKHDIRLGDVVVSARSSGKGGVFQYDYGKAIQEHAFEATGSLNEPPQLLLTALSGLEAKYELDRQQLSNNIENVLEQRPHLRKKYSRPHPDTDRLYRSDVVHQGSDACDNVCSNDPTCLVDRKERDDGEDDPTIHYGLIASANQLMKDAIARDKLSTSMDVLCFEMEAAGLMNHFPCLVIRGICDYADSHKNKQWQGFAAMMAAAYAKDLLCQVVPSRVESERRIRDILSGFQEIAQEHRDVSKEHRDIAKEQLQAQKDLAKEKLSEDQQRCHQLFRLTTSSKDTTYEWYKSRVEEKVEGTCMWFLKHQHFLKWLDQESGPLLVTADPGCGKSVLAKYLIDYGLPRLATICYFFFKDQDQNTARQALCALLHQLFSQKPFLIEYAMLLLRKNGQGLINSTKLLWDILRNAISDSRAGPVIIVLDALDECAELEFADLMRNIDSQFRSDQPGYGKLKYLLTCRPYYQIVSKFRGLLDSFPNIRIPGEEESEMIVEEVNYVITYRVNQLAMKKRLSTQIKSYLEKRLKKATHRTYLWVYLVFDYLGKEDFKKTPKGVETAITILPASIDEAYDRILSKSKKDPMVRKALCIILAASRPLTISEMNVAVNIDYTLQSIHDLDLEHDEDFKTRLRSWCGLFVSIHQGNIYFIHQTAREFLLTDMASPKNVPSALHWHRSIASQEAHAVLAEVCVLYLNYFNSNDSLETGANGGASHSSDRHVFLKYSAQNWGTHLREAYFTDGVTIIPFALRICDPDSKSYPVWFRIYWKTTGIAAPLHFTNLMIASYYGHHEIVKLLLEKGANVEANDNRGCTPLLWAAKNGHDAVVKLLLAKGANIEVKDSEHGETSLAWAAKNGHDAVVQLLLAKGAHIEALDDTGGTPLSWAAGERHEAVVKLLLEKGANVEVKDSRGWTPLSWAAKLEQVVVIKLLLEKGADIETKDSHDATPLSRAAAEGHEEVVKLLLEEGADIEAKDSRGWTPLLGAARHGRDAIAKLLLEKGANIKAEDNVYGRTPLSWAAEPGHEAVVKLLLEEGADIEAKDSRGETPLLWAAAEGHEAVVKLLLEEGADIEAKDNCGRTPLQAATDYGHEAMVTLLLGAGQRNGS